MIALDGFPDDRLLGQCRFHGRLNNQLVDLDQLRGMFDHTGLRVGDA